MDLILWRHADAEDGDSAPADDRKRKLTPRGERQASRVALWLHRQMPDGLRILVSPAVRAQRTAAKLERPFTTVESIGPDARAKDLLAASGWPDARRTVLLVGHQPALGELVSLLLTGREAPWTIRNAIRLHAFVPVSNNVATLVDGANCDATYHGQQIGLWRETFSQAPAAASAVSIDVRHRIPSAVAASRIAPASFTGRDSGDGVLTTRSTSPEVIASMTVR